MNDELRKLAAFNPAALELLDTVDCLIAEVNEQARLNGMGSEREARLLAVVAEQKELLEQARRALPSCNRQSEGRIMSAKHTERAELIVDLRLNHEYCPKEVLLKAADMLEAQAQQAEMFTEFLDEMHKLHASNHNHFLCAKNVWKERTK